MFISLFVLRIGIKGLTQVDNIFIFVEPFVEFGKFFYNIFLNFFQRLIHNILIFNNLTQHIHSFFQSLAENFNLLKSVVRSK